MEQSSHRVKVVTEHFTQVKFVRKILILQKIKNWMDHVLQKYSLMVQEGIKKWILKRGCKNSAI